MKNHVAVELSAPETVEGNGSTLLNRAPGIVELLESSC